MFIIHLTVYITNELIEPKKYAQVIRVRGAAAPRVFELELLVRYVFRKMTFISKDLVMYYSIY